TFDRADATALVTLQDLDGRVLATMTRVDATHGRLSLAELAPGAYLLGLEQAEAAGVGYDLAIRAPATALPALVATLVADLAFGAVGDPVEFMISVVNAGGAPSGAFALRTVWSRDRALDPGDANLIAPIEVPSLAPGQKFEHRFVARIPDAVAASVYFGVVADARGQVAEAVRTDNEAVQFLRITLPLDAFELNDDVGDAFELGGLVTGRVLSGLNISEGTDIDWFSVRLPTVGTAQDRIRFERLSSRGLLEVNLRDAAGTVLFSVSPTALNPDPSQGSFSLENLPAGRYFIEVRPLDDLPFEYQLALESAPRSGPNLVARSIGVRPELLAGFKTDVEVEVGNFGADLAAAFTVRLSVETPGGRVTLGEQAVARMEPGESRTVVVSFTPPSDLAGAELTLVAVVDADGRLDELSETDNTVQAISRGVSNPGAAESDERARGFVDLGVVRGERAATGFNLHSALDQDLFGLRLLATGADTDFIEATFDGAVGALRLTLLDGDFVIAAESTTVSPGVERLSLRGVEAGQYRLVVADLRNPERVDYALRLRGPAPAGPNLFPVSIQIADRFVSGTSLGVDLAYGNSGAVATGAFGVRFYLSTDVNIDPARDTPLTAVLAAPTLSPDATSNLTQTLSLGTLAAGRYYLGAILDAGGAVTESSETDNIAVAEIVVRAAPDAFEPNDAGSAAPLLDLATGRVLLERLTIHDPSDVDRFRFQLDATGYPADVLQLTYRSTEPDLLLELRDADGIGAGTILGVGGTATLSLRGLTPGTYTVTVSGIGAGEFSSGYSLLVDLRQSVAAGKVSAGGILPVTPGTGAGPGTSTGGTSSAGQPRLAGPDSASVAAWLAFSERAASGQGGSVGSLLNGDFGIADRASDRFGWLTVGDAGVSGGVGVLREAGLMLSRFSQILVVPSGATQLRLTLSGVSLGTGSGEPGDALEVALLDTTTGLSIRGALPGMPGGDALLNAQGGTGVFRLAGGVSVNGLATSGTAIPAQNGTYAVSISLSGIEAGTELELFLDLVGFGDREARAAIDDVRWVSGPELDFGLDPATDGGAVGDQVTHVTPVNFIGSTVPGLTVTLDLDGDGFDDGSVLADDAGRFLFRGVSLKAGVNPVRMQVVGTEGTSTVERVFTVDQVAPRLTGIQINGGAAQRSMVKSILLQFSEDVSGSLSAEDLILRNLSTQTDVLAGNQTWSFQTDRALLITFPNLPGESLADGNYTLALRPSGITDAAGNALADAMDLSLFRYFGDADGDRDVDFLDAFRFREAARNDPAADPGTEAFDVNADGVLEGVDVAAFQNHQLTRLPAPPPAGSVVFTEQRSTGSWSKPALLERRSEVNAEADWADLRPVAAEAGSRGVGVNPRREGSKPLVS
ncbi:MAG: hypothetical protein IT580_24825, partial [Verrucomicrobiales bacterium]|nr:hypothetical protein [Verrucomicrobiales bacterium]